MREFIYFVGSEQVFADDQARHGKARRGKEKAVSFGLAVSFGRCSILPQVLTGEHPTTEQIRSDSFNSPKLYLARSLLTLRRWTDST